MFKFICKKGSANIQNRAPHSASPASVSILSTSDASSENAEKAMQHPKAVDDSAFRVQPAYRPESNKERKRSYAVGMLFLLLWLPFSHKQSCTSLLPFLIPVSRRGDLSRREVRPPMVFAVRLSLSAVVVVWRVAAPATKTAPGPGPVDQKSSNAKPKPALVCSVRTGTPTPSMVTSHHQCRDMLGLHAHCPALESPKTFQMRFWR